MKTVKLTNGIEMPQIGYGVYQVTPQECERCVTDVLKVGYRIQTLDTGRSLFFNHHDGEVTKMFMKWK